MKTYYVEDTNINCRHLHLIIVKARPAKKRLPFEISITELFDFYFQDTREKNEAFGSSLLLANSPMSPKVVNGSFAAIVDVDEFLAKAYAGIRIAVSFFSISMLASCCSTSSLLAFNALFVNTYIHIFNDAESRFTGNEASSPWDSDVGPAVLA